MHGGKSLVLFFLYSGELLSGEGKLSRTHIIYIRYSADRKNNYYFEKKLKKVAKKFGRLKNMLYLCNRK